MLAVASVEKGSDSSSAPVKARLLVSAKMSEPVVAENNISVSPGWYKADELRSWGRRIMVFLGSLASLAVCFACSNVELPAILNALPRRLAIFWGVAPRTLLRLLVSLADASVSATSGVLPVTGLTLGSISLSCLLKADLADLTISLSCRLKADLADLAAILP